MKTTASNGLLLSNHRDNFEPTVNAAVQKKDNSASFERMARQRRGNLARNFQAYRDLPLPSPRVDQTPKLSTPRLISPVEAKPRKKKSRDRSSAFLASEDAVSGVQCLACGTTFEAKTGGDESNGRHCGGTSCRLTAVVDGISGIVMPGAGSESSRRDEFERQVREVEVSFPVRFATTTLLTLLCFQKHKASVEGSDGDVVEVRNLFTSGTCSRLVHLIIVSSLFSLFSRLRTDLLFDPQGRLANLSEAS